MKLGELSSIYTFGLKENCIKSGFSGLFTKLWTQFSTFLKYFFWQIK